MTRFANPVLPGSHPDPSICRVGDDYYLATSTFALFPGIALHHSRDLVHWRPIGAALDRPSQLDLTGLTMLYGIYAPTLRHHDGVFYLVCTVVGEGAGGNFLVTATDPAGSWSEPTWVEDAPGFDPSLLFDDGKVWYCGTWQHDPVGEPGRTTVWVQELDVATGVLLGERHAVWTGALVGATWAEGPHLYRIGDYVYLVAAEAGTDWNHAIVVARSTSVTGPYQGCPANPVLSSRHLGRTADVVGPGHADLVETQDGEWWAVLLAARPSDGPWWGTSRETFLVPVAWEEGWPVFAPGVGRVQLSLEGPSLASHEWPARPTRDEFDGAALDPEWSCARVPQSQWWSLSARPGHLQLQARTDTPYDIGNPSMLLRRVEQAAWQASLSLELTGDRGGLILWVSDSHQLRVEYDGQLVRLIRREDSAEVTVAEHAVGPGPVRLQIEAHGRDSVVRAAGPGDTWTDVGKVDLGFLGQLVNGYFFGMLVGPYAVGAGEEVADVDWFEYGDVSLFEPSDANLRG
ncbi:glycoside hydrolase family 43 protein [Acidothermaceae bacterium B102]|nr:glycoside hydrolase family 43 protein [Acidothermaceae bacterium B102]